MATVIDSFLMMFGIDASGVKRGGQEVRDEVAKTRGKMSDMSATTDGLKKSLGSLFAALGTVYAVKRFVMDITDADAIMARFSKNIGMSTQELSTWDNVARHFGGKGGEMAATFESISAAVSDMRLTGQSGLLPYFRALGVNLSDAQGGALPLSNILMQIGDGLRKLPNRSDAYNIAKKIGFDDATINAMLTSRAEMTRLLGTMNELGVATDEWGEDAKQMQSAWADMGTSMKGVQRDIVSQVAPYITWALGKVKDIFKWFHDNKTVTIAVFADLGIIASIFAGPVVLAAEAVLAVVSAIGLLYEDYQVWAKGGTSLFDWTWFKNAVDMAAGAWDKLAFAIQGAIGAFDKWLDRHPKLKKAIKDAGDWLAPHFRFERKPDGQTSATPATGQKIGGDRNWRNNNPGNIEYGPFARAHGATGSDGRFAKFPTMEAGYAAADALMKSSSYQGLTISQAVARWAPTSENNTGAYINHFRNAGFDVNQRYSDLSPSEQRRYLEEKMRYEGGRPGRIVGDAASVPGYHAQQAARQMIASSSSSRTSNVSIGAINVDARGAQDGYAIGDGIRRTLTNSGIVYQAEAGLA